MPNLQKTTLGGGCFWCVEAVYKELRGIHQIISGYAGGDLPNPTYQQICTGQTGHAEVIQLTFDADVISFQEILEIFWATHDPTTLNRQGNDVGTQYRSVIFYHDDEQKRIAAEAKATTDASNLWPNPIVTEISPLPTFYPAETYHQDYFANNPYQPYCMVVINPKISKVRRKFKEKLAR